MKRFLYGLTFLFLLNSVALAEVVELEDKALAVFGEACEEIKAGEQNAAVRLRAMDKACFSAVSALPEIIDIKDSFEEHDFNVMIYNIVDEYIEDLTTKRTKQNDEKVCIEVSGYVTPENIGKAIDETIKNPAPEQTVEANIQPDVKKETESVSLPQPTLLPRDDQNVVVLSTIFVRPTEFYNNTRSNSHSAILRKFLTKSENVVLVNDEEDANFVITPQVLKAKIEPLNSETNRLQMVLAIETYDRNKNDKIVENHNKFVLFKNEDNEQEIAKNLLTQLFEQGSASIVKLANQSGQKIYQKHAHAVSASGKVIVTEPSQEDASISDKQPYLN